MNELALNALSYPFSQKSCEFICFPYWAFMKNLKHGFLTTSKSFVGNIADTAKDAEALTVLEGETTNWIQPFMLQMKNLRTREGKGLAHAQMASGRILYPQWRYGQAPFLLTILVM